MNDQNHYRISVKGIVIDKAGRFLLAKEEDGQWELLGGGLHHNEEPIDGLKREVMEEAGLEVTYVSPTPKYFYTFPKVGHEGHAANVVYEMNLKNLDFTPSEECIELRFFTVEEAHRTNPSIRTAKFLDLFDPSLHK